MDGLNSKLFLGIITSSDAGTYNISIDPYGSNKPSIMQGIPLVSIFATTLGFKECPTYSIGVTVLCYQTTAERCYIIGLIPEADVGNFNFYSRACLQTSDGNFDSQNIQGYADQGIKLLTHNQNRPTDVVEGEYVVANEFGVLLGLFQQMATLKGSELAQIQCYVMDDLVRLISHNFQHFSALGEFNIWHDGKAIMAEFGGTHLSPESLGASTIKSFDSTPTFAEDDLPQPDDSSDYYKFQDNIRLKAIERLKIFLGRLGDFFHLFLVKPDDSASRTLAGSSGDNFDTGLADVHVSTDGRISMRSVSSIVMEKTNWIMVPNRVRLPEDPKGDDGSTISFEDKDPFVFDNTYKYQDNPMMYFLQMRDCVAYLQDFYNYKNFLKYTQDFELSKGPQNQETNLNDITQVDPNTKVKFSDYVLRKSGFYMMDNGGWMIKDAWGSAIVLEGGNIYLQPAKDLVSQPLRNFIVKAGQFTSICSKKDIDISSSEAGFRLKTQDVQYFYSDEQGIILHSNAMSTGAPSPDDEAFNQFGGILFKAADSGVYTYSQTIFDRATDSALYKGDRLVIEGDDNNLYLIGTEGIYILSENEISLEADQTLQLISKGDASFGGAQATILGQQGQIVSVAPAPGAPPAIFNGILDCAGLATTKASIGQMLDQSQLQPFTEDSKFDDVKFKFLSSDDYDLSDNEDFIPMTVAQQDDTLLNSLSLTNWMEAPINDTYPYPGADSYPNFYIKSSLTNLQQQDNDLYSKGTDDLNSSANQLEVTSLDNYKILES